MKQFVGIALYTFREAVRNKILYSIVFFAVALIFLAVAMGSASFSQNARIIKDLGMFALHFFSDVIAIFLGVTMVFQEMERKTIYNILSKPVARSTYFFGKFAGMALTLAVQLVVMAIALTLVQVARGDEIPVTYSYAVWLVYVECLVVLSFALFFSSFSTPYVSGFMALGVWLVGGLVQNLEATLTQIPSAWTRGIARAVVALSPDLSMFTLTTQLTYDVPVEFGYVTQATGYGGWYALLFLVAGALVFSKRDFI